MADRTVETSDEAVNKCCEKKFNWHTKNTDAELQDSLVHK